ncbi:MAG TPA: dUTP diphosphatase [Bacillota bacterium]|nr:dUTP diphosphatase [Peptococcaceae bacterium MAG4]HQD76990.1 dUTP diphosphatase [Bacillota bacterium]HUM59678.1 dUTP diphosphatase [Bacillota bacterium]
MEQTMVIRVKKYSESIGKNINIPEYATAGSAGLDLPACLEEPLILPPGARAKIPTGIAIELPHRHVAGLILPRSGLATNHGITLANAVGLIDSDYKGEIFIAVVNQSEREYTIKPGERIAQLVFIPVYHVSLEIVEELGKSSRGTGGFGSTGRI